MARSRSSAQPLRLRIACRRLIEQTSDDEICEVRLNGASVGTLAAGNRWQQWDLGLPARNVRQGLNRLEILWPSRTLPGLRLAAADFESSFNFDLMPIFGEISTLTIAIADVSSQQDRARTGARR